ncbi:MAG: DUF1028 domain-containing protein [Betaproteobacteria bacterium]
MTFSILGRCARTGKAGFCQATSTPAVGWRITDIVPGKGVVTIQAHGDYRRLQVAKKLIEFGHTPEKVLKDLCEGDKYFEFRQFAILDYYGNFAVRTGNRTRSWAGEIAAHDHIATGNVLVGEQVVRAMSEAFVKSEGEELEERFMRALEAGRDAGGQEEGQTSAAIVVFGRHEFPLVNLRVDVSAEPVGELRRNLDWFKPLIDYYEKRTLDPGSVEPKKQYLEKLGLKANPYR